jgi:tetratricopeptide (TPR) repeat protein
VKKLLQDKTHLKQLKDNSKREMELLLKVAILEDENRKLVANKQSTQKLKKDFQQASQGLMALDWFNKALSLWDGERYTDPKQAIEYLSNAISLQPDMAATYRARGNAYYDLGKHQLAIEDFTEAIRLKPDYVDAHYIRGNAYYKLGHYPRAIEDLKIAAGLGHEVAQVILKSSGIGSISADVPIVKKPDKPLELAVEQVQSPQVKSENYEDINSNAAKQSVLIAWQKAQREFFSENPDYSKDKALNNTYVSILDELISKPEAAKMTDRQILLEAKRIVENSLGTLPKPPKVDAGESYSVITGLTGIELRNGDVIEGQVISVDSDFVMIRTKDGKVLSYSFIKEFRWFITE